MLLHLNGYAIFNILNGAIFIVLFAVCLGIVSGSKKLFEILFFLLTYTITQKLPPADYLGAIKHNGPLLYPAIMLGLKYFFINGGLWCAQLPGKAFIAFNYIV
jgi:hypothetical protein